MSHRAAVGPWSGNVHVGGFKNGELGSPIQAPVGIGTGGAHFAGLIVITPMFHCPLPWGVGFVSTNLECERNSEWVWASVSMR
jgi:hypothetical protein